MALITELDDQLLVEAHHAGDSHAFELIVERHHAALLRHAYRRLHDASLADDAVQETLLRAFRALPRFDGDYRLDAWLHRILTNVCFDMGRRHGRDVALFDKVAASVDDVVPAVDDQIPSDDPSLVAALESLPAGYRDVLVMRLVDELSYADVADRVGISEDNARARVSRGRSMLRKALSGANAALVWLIPPLRRNTLTPPAADGGELASSMVTPTTALAPAVHGATPIVSAAAPAASGAAPAISTAAPLVSGAAPVLSSAAPAVSTAATSLSGASSVLAQAAPALVQAAPAVQSSAPVLGKAVMAVGIAATVAIPAGKAVEERIHRPEPVSAPAADDADLVDPAADVAVSTDAPASSVPAAPPSSADIAPTSEDTAVPVDLGARPAPTTRPAPPAADEGEGAPTGADSPTTAPASSTTTAPAPEQGAPAPADPTPAQPTAGPRASFLGGDLTVAVAGPRWEVSGPFVIDTADGRLSGTLAGKVLVGAADPKDPGAPRSFEGDLTLTMADGTTHSLRMRGRAIVTETGDRTDHDLAATFRFSGASSLGLDEAGDLTGTFSRSGDSGALHLSLPTPPQDDGDHSSSDPVA